MRRGAVLRPIALTLAAMALAAAGCGSSQAPGAAGELAMEDIARFDGFPLYGATETLAGFPLTAVRVQPDFVSLIYGDCDPSGSDGGCAPPLEVQVWRACKRSLDDYELMPGTPFPHRDLTIRGTQAAGFDDRLELYAGSVTVVVFAGPDVARQAMEELRPLNDLAESEAAEPGGGELPPPNPVPDCV